MKISEALGSDIPLALREVVERTFLDLERHYLAREWQSVGSDCGHFVEAVRRIIEHYLFGSYTPVGKSLPAFNEACLKSYENKSGEDSLRILLPRLLYSLYALRNKRSMGHLGLEPAKQMDAMLLLYGAKWSLAELIRLTSDADVSEAFLLINRLSEHEISPIWREGDIIRVLDPKASARDKVILVLGLVGPMSDKRLQQIVEYKHASNFKKILKRLHASKLIEYSGADCSISPLGLADAKRLSEKPNMS